MQLTTLDNYSTFEEANLDKQILKRYNIQTFFDTERILEKDFVENLNYTTIRLLIDDNDYQRAVKILRNNISNDQFKKIEIQHTLKKPKYKVTCPECNSNNIYRDEEIIDIYLNFVVRFLRLKIKQRYICYYCENKFKI